MLLFDVRLQRDAKPLLDGVRVAHVDDRCALVTNMNTIPGDRNALFLAGIRLGSMSCIRYVDNYCSLQYMYM